MILCQRNWWWVSCSGYLWNVKYTSFNAITTKSIRIRCQLGLFYLMAYQSPWDYAVHIGLTKNAWFHFCCNLSWPHSQTARAIRFVFWFLYFRWQNQQGRTYMQQFCAYTGCRLEDLPEAMDYKEGWTGVEIGQLHRVSKLSMLNQAYLILCCPLDKILEVCLIAFFRQLFFFITYSFTPTLFVIMLEIINFKLVVIN